ncbi:hypothetical protein SUGI_0703220 [Cryptomeria japonica]|nr:hypothetical protein SUGI_0703220 [Cryptomeria japonica]
MCLYIDIFYQNLYSSNKRALLFFEGFSETSAIIWGAYYYCCSKWALLSLAEFSEASTIIWGVLLKRKYYYCCIWHLGLTVQIIRKSFVNCLNLLLELVMNIHWVAHPFSLFVKI